jgi:hypothetical protein
MARGGDRQMLARLGAVALAYVLPFGLEHAD